MAMELYVWVKGEKTAKGKTGRLNSNREWRHEEN
jgi:hypothetical protein